MSRVHTDAILLLAGRQHGIVTRWQLAAAGVPRAAVENEIRRGRLGRSWRSVYLVPALADHRSAETALIYSFGRFAAASHHTAAALHNLLPHPDRTADISITRGHPRPRSGIRIYRTPIPGDEISVCDAVPVTTADRTLLDLAAVLPERSLERALAAAVRSSLVTEASVLTLISRYPRRNGGSRLSRLIASASAPAFTRSEAEERFLRLMRRAKIPQPIVNAPLLGYEVDFYWPAHGLVVEIDGAAFHSSPTARERDRRRDVTLVSGGFRVIRLIWADLADSPEATVATISFALARALG